MDALLTFSPIVGGTDSLYFLLRTLVLIRSWVCTLVQVKLDFFAISSTGFLSTHQMCHVDLSGFLGCRTHLALLKLGGFTADTQ